MDGPLPEPWGQGSGSEIVKGKTMFFKSVKSAWEAGKVKVGLPAVGRGEGVTVEAKGLVGLMAKFLSSDERKELAALSKKAAVVFLQDCKTD